MRGNVEGGKYTRKLFMSSVWLRVHGNQPTQCENSGRTCNVESTSPNGVDEALQRTRLPQQPGLDQHCSWLRVGFPTSPGNGSEVAGQRDAPYHGAFVGSIFYLEQLLKRGVERGRFIREGLSGVPGAEVG